VARKEEDERADVGGRTIEGMKDMGMEGTVK